MERHPSCLLPRFKSKRRWDTGFRTCRRSDPELAHISEANRSAFVYHPIPSGGISGTTKKDQLHAPPLGHVGEELAQPCKDGGSLNLGVYQLVLENYVSRTQKLLQPVGGPNGAGHRCRTGRVDFPRAPDDVRVPSDRQLCIRWRCQPCHQSLIH